MKHRLIALTLCAIAAGWAAPAVRAIAADDPAAYFENECLDCHKRKKKPLEEKHLSRQEWKDAIDKMIDLEKLDPVPSKAFIAALSDWLASTHGPTVTAQPASSPASDATK
ncbi:MAG: hypothetical protein ACXWJM_01420 [Ramlibacter sp.]